MEDRRREEAALIERARAGDVNAYARLMELHEAVAMRVAYFVARNEADAAEAVQEGFFRAYRALQRFRVGEPFRPWLLRIVANEARNRRAASLRFVENTVRLAADTPASSGRAPSAEWAVLGRETRRELIRAINALRESDRLIIALRFFLELSEKEIAAVLQCPGGTVKSRLSRALDRLRKELEQAA